MIISGSATADNLIGTVGDDTLVGLEGDDQLSGAQGFDTYIFGPGFGTDVITESTGTNGGRIRFESGITPADLRFERFANNPQDLLIIVGTDSVRIRDFYDSSGNIRQRIDAIEFENGDDPIDLLTANFPFIGTPDAETLNGTPQDETFIGLEGDDQLSGAQGFDTYIFGPGFGTDVITESTGTNGGRIRFESGITPADLRFERFANNPQDLLIIVGTDSVRIRGFYDSSGNIRQRIDTIEFENGDDPIDLLTADFPFIGTPNADTLNGTFQDETFIGLGDDDQLSGGAGFDTYIFGPGFGTDVITESMGTNGGRIRFEGEITPADLRFERFANDPRDLLIIVGTDSVRIRDFYDSSGNIRQVIDAIEFENGDDPIDLLTADFPFIGTPNADTLNGTFQDETFIGLGDDDQLSGGAGFDTYIFAPGFGTDVITESMGTNGGRIRFEGEITPADLRFERFANDPRDLLIIVGTDSVRIRDFYDSSGNIRQVIDAIEFENGDDPIDLLTADFPFIGTPNADTLNGTFQDETFIGLGDDDQLSGGAGFDTYIFAPGFGTDVITESMGTNGGRIRFEGEITPADLRFERFANDPRDLLIIVGTDSVRIRDFYDSSGNIRQVIDAIEFENGQQLSLTDIEFTESGVSSNNPPDAQNDSVTTGIGEDVELSLLANDSDPNGDTLQITAVSDTPFIPNSTIDLPSGALVTISEEGIATYKPSPLLSNTLMPGEDFIDNFNYQIGDGRGGFDFATITVTVEAPDPVELGLEISPLLAPGETGTAQLSIKVNSTGNTATSSADPDQAYLIAVSADRGLVSDSLSQSFGDTTFVLARGVSVGETGTLDISIKGTAGPRSTLSASAQLAEATTISDIAERTASLLPTFVEASVVSRVQQNLELRFGETIGSLTNAIAKNAAQLETFGFNGTSATAALAFAIEAAGDYGSLEERGQIGSLGQGWSTLADIGLAIDGTSVQLRGLADMDALRAISIDSSAYYTVSNSVGRSVALSGDVLALSAPARPVFEQGIDGQFRTVSAFDGELAQTDTGFQIELTDGDMLLFDAAGNFLHMEMIDGRQIVASHNTAMQVSSLSGPNGASLTFSRATGGKIESIEDADGRAITFSYDLDDKLESVSRAEGRSAFQYNADGDLTKSIAPGDVVGEFIYDSFGRLNQANYGNSAQIEDFAYDDAGGLTISDGVGRTTELDLLPGSIVGRITDGIGGASEIIYDDAGNISGVRAPDGTETAFNFDDEGRLTKITDANGAELGFTYGETGEEPESFTDAGGSTRNFDYDAGGRITEATWPDGTTLKFGYDNQGNLTGYTNRRGDDVDYTYDPRGRLLSESDSSAGPTIYTYDDRGRLTSATNDQGTTSLAYDSADRVTQIDYPTGKSLSYTYNDAGLRASISDGGEYNVFYDYDTLGRLTGLRDEDSQIVAYEYDGAGNLLHEENGNGTVSIFEYDEAGRLTRIENQAPDSSINSFNAYAYDVAGQRVTNESQDGIWTYGYDAIGQLTSANFASINAEIADKSLFYEYDAVGNRMRVVEDGTETLYTVNALNQYAQIGDAAFTYDADGNMTSRNDSNGIVNYTYDLDNRLVAATEANGSVLEFEYDVFGNRVGKTVDGIETEYLIDPFGLGDVVSEFAGGELRATYSHGLGLEAVESVGTIAFYDADAVGSVTSLTNASGAVLNRYAYDPFGGELLESEALSNPFEFNGTLGVTEDSDHLIFMRSRFYSDQLGRFLSEDPLFVTGDINNLNRSFLNAPLTFVDPDGQRNELAIRILDKANSNAIGNPFGAATDAGVSNGDLERTLGFGRKVADLERALLIQQANQSIGDSMVEAALEAFVDPKNPQKTYQEQNQLLDALKRINENGGIDPNRFYEQVSDAYFKREFEERLNGIETEAGDTEQVEQPPLGGGSISPEAAPRPRTGGDPHIQTFDSMGYSFQAVGEFIMFRGQNGEFEFQVRQSPLPGNDLVSVNSAVATMINGVAVGVYAGRGIPLAINGNGVELENGESIALGKGSVYRNDNVYVITNEFGDGVTVAVRSGFTDFLTIQNFLAPERGAGVEGLFGNADGIPENDLMLRDGTVLSLPVAATELYGVFADSWRITNETSFFDYLEEESTETFTDRSFPREAITLDDLDPDVRAAAEQIARNVGLVPGTFEFETTVLDVALSGDPAFAEATQDIPAFDPEFNPLTDFAVVVTVEVNEAPTANPDMAMVDEDETIDIDVLENDEDPEGDPLEILGAGDINGGQVDIVDGQLRFTPAAGFNGDTVISYQLGDRSGNSVLGSVNVEVGSVPDAPKAIDDFGLEFATDEDTAFKLPDFLSNDTDQDGDVVSLFSVDSAGLRGTLTDNGDGTFDYNPNSAFQDIGTGEQGSDSFNYRISDGTGLFDDGVVTISITGLNDVPAANDDQDNGFGTNEDTAFTTANVLENDTDAEGDTISVVGLDISGTLGLVSDNGDGTFDYDPNGAFESLIAGETGSDSFRYTISDGEGETSTATVFISVDGVDDATGPNPVVGTGSSDDLIGTDGNDAIRSLGGSYDKLFGDEGADQFIFGSETQNGVRERDVILDYEVGVDSIVLEDGATVGSIRQTSSQVVVFLEGDRDAIYVRGEGVTADNLTIVTDDPFDFV